MTTTIYHNPRCSKSRQSLQLLRDADIEPTVVEYLKAPPTRDELQRIVSKLGVPAAQLIRTTEKLYKELELGGRELSDEEALEILTEHPRLLQRPIVVHGTKAVIGRPPENVAEILH